MSSNLPPNMAVRAAVEGEVLVVHRFHNGFKGLSSPNHQDALEVESQIFTLSPDGNSIESADECAVCIPDGAEVVMTGISSAFQSRYGVSATEVVIFRQISEGDDTQLDVASAGRHHLPRRGIKEGDQSESNGLIIRDAGIQQFHSLGFSRMRWIGFRVPPIRNQGSSLEESRVAIMVPVPGRIFGTILSPERVASRFANAVEQTRGLAGPAAGIPRARCFR